MTFLLLVDGKNAGSEPTITAAMEHGRSLADAGDGTIEVYEVGTGCMWRWTPGRGFLKAKGE